MSNTNPLDFAFVLIGFLLLLYLWYMFCRMLTRTVKEIVTGLWEFIVDSIWLIIRVACFFGLFQVILSYIWGMVESQYGASEYGYIVNSSSIYSYMKNSNLFNWGINLITSLDYSSWIKRFVQYFLAMFGVSGYYDYLSELSQMVTTANSTVEDNSFWQWQKIFSTS